MKLLTQTLAESGLTNLDPVGAVSVEVWNTTSWESLREEAKKQIDADYILNCKLSYREYNGHDITVLTGDSYKLMS